MTPSMGNAAAIAVLTGLGAGIVVRARWMLPPRSQAVLVSGLALFGAALVGAVHQAEPDPLQTVHIESLWWFWVGVSGVAAIALVFARWWRAQSDRHRPSDVAARSPVLWGAGVLEWTVILLLPFGGGVPFLGWILTMLLLWTARIWSPNEKLIATLALPGGPLVAAVFINSIGTSGLSGGLGLVLIVTWGLLALLPLAASVFLARRLAARSHAEPMRLGAVQDHAE
jgi:hypothetical protein